MADSRKDRFHKMTEIAEGLDAPNALSQLLEAYGNLNTENAKIVKPFLLFLKHGDRYGYDFKKIFKELYIFAIPLRTPPSDFHSFNLQNIIDYMMETYQLNTPALQGYNNIQFFTDYKKVMGEEKEEAKILRELEEIDKNEKKDSEEKARIAYKKDQEILLDLSTKAQNIPNKIHSHLLFQYMTRDELTQFLYAQGLNDELRKVIVIDDIVKLQTILKALSQLDAKVRDPAIERCDDIIKEHTENLQPEVLKGDFNKLFGSVKVPLMELINPASQFYNDFLTFLFLNQEKDTILKILMQLPVDKRDNDPIGSILLLERCYHVLGGPEKILQTILTDYSNQSRQEKYFRYKLVKEALKELKQGRFVSAYEMLSFSTKAIPENVQKNNDEWTLTRIVEFFKDPKTAELYKFYRDIDLEKKSDNALEDESAEDEILQETTNEFEQSAMTDADREWGSQDTENSSAEWDEAVKEDIWNDHSDNKNDDEEVDEEIRAKNQMKAPGK